MHVNVDGARQRADRRRLRALRQRKDTAEGGKSATRTAKCVMGRILRQAIHGLSRREIRRGETVLRNCALI